MAWVYCIHTKGSDDIFSVVKALGSDISWGTLYRVESNEHYPNADRMWRFVTEFKLENPSASVRFSHDNPDNPGIAGYSKHDNASRTSDWDYKAVSTVEIEKVQRIL